MEKFRNVPAIITLLTGFIACVIMIIREYTLVDFLWKLVFVMAAFYVFGLLVRFVLNKVFKTPDEGSEEDENEEGTEEGAESDTPGDKNNQDNNAE